MSMNLLEECRGAKRIGISGHIRPDGDCIGACMGLYLYLKKEIPQADVQVFLEKTGGHLRLHQRDRGCGQRVRRAGTV